MVTSKTKSSGGRSDSSWLLRIALGLESRKFWINTGFGLDCFGKRDGRGRGMRAALIQNFEGIALGRLLRVVLYGSVKLSIWGHVLNCRTDELTQQKDIISKGSSFPPPLSSNLTLPGLSTLRFEGEVYPPLWLGLHFFVSAVNLFCGSGLFSRFSTFFETYRTTEQ